MIVTYMRSSSYGRFDMCEFQYYMEYVLGWRMKSGKAADIGTISHKVMEFLAQKKKALQIGAKTFGDAETNKEYSIDTSLEAFIEIAWTHYTTGPAAHHKWDLKDKKKIYANVYDYTTYNNGNFNPLNMKIIECEQYFDYTIEEDWARYEYTDDKGNTIKGNLAVKGVMDLVTHHNDNVLCYLDYKTGRFWDWGYDKPKTLESLTADFQPRIYHYALTKLFPQYKLYCMTFFYNNDGGPRHMVFEKEDINKAMQLLKNRFLKIKNTKMPTRRPKMDEGSKWKCSRLCDYGKIKDINSPYYKGKDEELTICDRMYNEVQQLGLERVTNKYADLAKVNIYRSGGGVSDRSKVQDE